MNYVGKKGRKAYPYEIQRVKSRNSQKFVKFPENDLKKCCTFSFEPPHLSSFDILPYWISLFPFIAREDRYRHEWSDDDDDDDEGLPDLHFTSCSPRFSKLLSDSRDAKSDDSDKITEALEERSVHDRSLSRETSSDSSYASLIRTEDSDRETE